MKSKSILAILLLMASLQTAMAQKLVLHLTGNQAVEYDISQLDSISFIEGTTEEHEYVDLGLPSGTLWATCNVGANSPEEYGDYFAWGETQPKSDNNYSESAYRYYDSVYNVYTKYCLQSDYGTIDNKSELEMSDDAATVNWGIDWQIPSFEQFKELINSSYTTTTWTTLNGVKGRMIVSKSNGNRIFLPAAGSRYGTSPNLAGSRGYYWSRSLYTSRSNSAYYLLFNPSSISTDHSLYRYSGQSVRPVRVKRNKESSVTSIELNKTEFLLFPNVSTQLKAIVLPWYATNKNVKWESSNKGVATIDQTGKVIAVAIGSCTVTCSATDGSGVKAECKVTVKNDNSGTLDGHDYVDLGLPSGTLWATCNVGANSPEEYGDYFAWGETEPKTTYDWSTYKYSKGSYDTMTKYCTNSDYGTVDNKTELEPSDDAATVNWGSGWQMPSFKQFDELYNSSNTITTWTTMNGVKGRMITSKSNGNSIFLPTAGCRNGTSLNYAGSGYYRSRSLYTSDSYFAYSLYFDSSSIGTDGHDRSNGASVRPVRVKESIAVSTIELSQTELSVKVGKTTQLTATVLPTDADNPAVAWESSNADVATVGQTGKVTAVAVGNCIITCSATDGSGVKVECQVEVVMNETHEYVDLGLASGTLWAAYNVGANSPEEYGDYYAWGETEPKNDYYWSTYKYCQGSSSKMTKYCTSSSYGTVDNKTELDPSDDAATVNWGSNWQMPSEKQFNELFNSSYTTTTWTTMNGKYGRKITSKSNGNSIFLPAAGYRYGTSISNAGSYGYYWSRSLNTSNSAYCLRFNSSDISTSYDGRCYGQGVRPVRVNGVQTVAVSNIELSQTELSVKVGETTQLSATVLPDNATNKNLKWASSNTDIATVDETGKVTALAVGTCTITCSATDGSGVKAECKVTVPKDNSGTIDGRDYVDLGLPSGTLWATCNVGASSPEEYGDYFAWGETQPKSNYDWSTYKYCKGSYDKMTKYCTSSSYGTVDNKTELEPSDDAATANWGSDWQMPSLEQFRELFNSSYTTTTWTTMNGVYGRKITSKSNGNSIFLPAAGCRGTTNLIDAGSFGYYWSRSLYTSLGDHAYLLCFDSSNVSAGGITRDFGPSVRPVRVKN